MDSNFFENDFFYQIFNINLNKIVLKNFKFFKEFFENSFKNILEIF
jgi:hypothetical protein